MNLTDLHFIDNHKYGGSDKHVASAAILVHIATYEILIKDELIYRSKNFDTPYQFHQFNTNTLKLMYKKVKKISNMVYDFPF